ncbi:NAD(P)/FAD-dependent oxidoreductase [Nitratireductor sp. StC3]|uniref:NAD(P)/FAD-dependent oxidoreductase n=1 Tax=Nitratireductor sp. StC3 TaxID=2126741 RepID=UPI000D0DF7D6|nr:NAD(P)/FAD-dependent oxidoreductase [Nitratireductor sp. StC3]PSM15930.1 FAD/NAD(P)-binding oxidoreductase [Nitratireductor sp. StC3]
MKNADEIFDVAIIGGGVVGCAMARRLTLDGAKLVLLERAPDILSGASKANSAILHTGFDAPPDSLELACVQAGYREYREIRKAMNLPLLETDAMVVAWTGADMDKLDGIENQARQNGVARVRRLTARETRAREPELSSAAAGALLVPGEHVIDPWTAPLAYLRQAVVNGAQVRLNSGVTAGRFDGAAWQLDTPHGSVRATAVINCAGLHGDTVEQCLLGRTWFTIKPRKGQFVVYDKAAAKLLSSIVLPVPSERTKGVVLTRTVFGNLLVGPTAEDQDDRERASVEAPVLDSLIATAVKMVPALETMPVTAVYAGLRPATEIKDYRVRAIAEQNWISVGGIRSTGLTAALGLAAHVATLHAAFGGSFTPLEDPAVPRMANLADHRNRPWQATDHGEIVCHCELVTRGEVEAALQGPLPAGDFGGLKRRTRVCMGRCQGFYCQARVAALTAGRLAEPLSVGPAHG